MSVFRLKIVTADGEYYDGEAQSLVVRTIDGDVCIMARHTPYLTALGMGECRLTEGDGTKRRAACIGGMLSVMNNEVNLVATTFEWAENIDVSRAERARERAQAMLSGTNLDPKDLELANAKLKRALTRINVGK